MGYIRKVSPSGKVTLSYTYEKPLKQHFTVYDSIGNTKHDQVAGQTEYVYMYKGRQYKDTPEDLYRRAGACNSLDSLDLYNRAVIVTKLAKATSIDMKLQEEKAEAERKNKEMAFKGKHEDLSGYVEDLRLLHADLTEERHIARDVLTKAQEEYNSACKTGNESAKMITRGKLAEAEEAYKSVVSRLEKTAEEKIRAGRSDIQAHLDGYYKARGEALDSGTLALFNSGLKLKVSEYEELLERFSGSPTMLRLIVQKAEEAEAKSEAIGLATVRVRAEGKEELSEYDTLADLVRHAVGKDEGRAEAWGYNSRNFDRISNELKASFAGYAVSDKEM